jgi:chromosome segregation ATPase
VLELQEEEKKRLVRSTSARDELAKVQQELALAQAERDSAAAEKKRLDEAIQVSQACLADCEEKAAAGQHKLAEVQEQLKGQAKVAEERQAKVEELGARLEELNREIGKKSGWLPTLFNRLTPRWVGGGWIGWCVVPGVTGGTGVLQVH